MLGQKHLKFYQVKLTLQVTLDFPNVLQTAGPPTSATEECDLRSSVFGLWSSPCILA